MGLLIIFTIIFFVTVMSASTILKQYLPNSNWVLLDISSFWIIASFNSAIFSLLTFVNADFYIYILLYFVLMLLPIYIMRKDLLSRIKNIKEFFNKDNYILPIIFFATIIVVSLIFVLNTQRWGEWDSWTIWNLHAKYIAGDKFNNIFEAPIFTARDYPLFLPSIIAIIWKQLQDFSPLVPIIISYLITVSVPGVLYFYFRQKNSIILTTILLVSLASNLAFSIMGAWQYADTFLSLFILITITFVYLWQENSYNKNIAIFIGFFAANCGWIKNEGLLFFLIISIFFIIKNRASIKNIILYVAGSIIPLSIILIYKFGITPPNDFISQLTYSEIVDRAFDITRHKTIMSFFIVDVLINQRIVLLILFISLFIFKSFKPNISGAVIITMFIFYYFVYISTKSDLMWNLQTSANRLFQHLFPAVLLIVFKSIEKSDSKIIRRISKI